MSGPAKHLTGPSNLQSNTAPRLENSPFTPFTTLTQSTVATGVPVAPKDKKDGTTTKLSQVERGMEGKEGEGEGGTRDIYTTGGINDSFSMTISVDSGTQGDDGPGSLLNGMSLTPGNSVSSGTGTFAGGGIPLFANTLDSTTMFSSSSQKSFNNSRALPKAPVQTNDASLSARSFSERLLVGMRDNSIEVGQEQVRMLTKQNGQLRRNLNEVEAEMIVLQNELTNKDNMITKKERELEEIQRECASLIGEMQKAEGRENAMNLASKQNTHLLRLLEMEEAKKTTLTDDRDSLNMQLGVVRNAHESLTKEAAENEAVMKEKMKRIRHKAFEKSREAEVNQTKAMELQANLAETERIAKFEISSMKDELMNRRDKVYELLDKLQATEDRLRKSEDLTERQQELLDSSEERGNDLDRRLNEVRIALAKREEELFTRQNALKEAEEAHNSKLGALEGQNRELEKQLNETSQKILELVERHEMNCIRKNEDDEKYESLVHEQELVRDQNQRLLESLNQKSKQYIQLEADHNDAQHLIQNLQTELETPRLGALKPPTGATEGTEDAVMSKKSLSKQKKILSKEAAARRRLFENFLVSLSHTTIVSDAIENKMIVEARNSLVLNDCHIDDIDMITLVSVLKGSKTITELNLVSNRIGDAGAAALAGLIALSNCKLSFIDMRNNGISMTGIRKLAEAVQNNKGRGIEHVYVHNDGKIDAIGMKTTVGGGGTEEGKEGETKDPSILAKIKNAMSSICVIDVRENFPKVLEGLRAPMGTEKTLWNKIYSQLPSEESLRIKASKKKALKKRKEDSEYRDALVGTIYGT